MKREVSEVMATNERIEEGNKRREKREEFYLTALDVAIRLHVPKERVESFEEGYPVQDASLFGIAYDLLLEKFQELANRKEEIDKRFLEYLEAGNLEGLEVMHEIIFQEMPTNIRSGLYLNLIELRRDDTSLIEVVHWLVDYIKSN